MFRWCAASGPKIIPTKRQLEDEFGFEVPQYATDAGGKITLQNWNDSHPGNHWSFTISSFLTCEDAFAQLENSGLSGEDVLWIRFRREEDSFDYEKLLRFTYHNCFAVESFDLVDKYVKGQEFPVVVIEGYPDECDPESFGDKPDAAEQAMWSARREVYLCCSRATTFLYFVLPRGAAGIADETREIVRQLSEPTNPQDVARRIWQIEFSRTERTRKMDAFHFQTPDEPPPPTVSEVPIELTIERPASVRRLYEALKQNPTDVISDLFALGATFQRSTDVVPDQVAKEVALRHGVILHMGDKGSTAAAAETNLSPPTGPRAEVDPATNTEKSGSQLQRSLNEQLSAFIDSGQFPWFANIVKRYLTILNWFLESVPNGRNQLLRYRREGASRRFFATSEEELHEHASSPNPHRIGQSDVWALTTTDSRVKREIVDDLFRECGISLEAGSDSGSELTIDTNRSHCRGHFFTSSHPLTLRLWSISLASQRLDCRGPSSRPCPTRRNRR